MQLKKLHLIAAICVLSVFSPLTVKDSKAIEIEREPWLRISQQSGYPPAFGPLSPSGPIATIWDNGAIVRILDKDHFGKSSKGFLSKNDLATLKRKLDKAWARRLVKACVTTVDSPLRHLEVLIEGEYHSFQCDSGDEGPLEDIVNEILSLPVTVEKSGTK